MNPETPSDLITWLEDRSRQQSIIDHAVGVGLDWWNDGYRGLPGLPVVAEGHTTGEWKLSRGEIFTLAEDAVDDESGTAALRLLWHALAWGAGPQQRGNAKRVSAVTADLPRIQSLLRDAAVASRCDAIAAFRLLRPGSRNAISYLGPNFATKYLYFAGGGRPEHPCVIVDARVRASLYRSTGKTDARFAPLSQYGAAHYQAALEVMRTWAAEASTTVGRPVAADEVERWAFGR